MPLTLTWEDVALRLLLTTIAGAAIGFERGERGHAAGLRTTLLVALAACLSMIQANWLMNSVGKTPDSFVVLDLMRLPLGILSGVGFIGGGAILKRGDLIRGVTTAATLWFVTVVGLCFGGGQLALGAIGAVLGFVIISGLKLVERRIKQERAARLAVRWRGEAFDESRLSAILQQSGGLRISKVTVKFDREAQTRQFECAIRLRTLLDDHRLPAPVAELARNPEVLALDWSA